MILNVNVFLLKSFIQVVVNINSPLVTILYIYIYISQVKRGWMLIYPEMIYYWNSNSLT